MLALLGYARPPPSISVRINCNKSTNHPESAIAPPVNRRKSILLSASLLTLFLNFNLNSSVPLLSAGARELDELEESTIIRVFEETSPSVVFIQVLSKLNNSNNSNDTLPDDESNAKVEGTGSGFLWDKFGHIVTNYHVVAKLATDQSGQRFCKVSTVDTRGNRISTEAKIIGFDQSYDLAVLKFDSQGKEFRPALLGTSSELRVGQNCFAIGNPYGYENTLTTGVVSGLGREIPSPNGQAIRGAIQTDTAINAVQRKGARYSVETINDLTSISFLHKRRFLYFNMLIAGNSGGPLIDSYGHVIGVNTATFTLKGTGMSSGVNFAIPIDTVVRTVPALIVYGTPYSDRY